MKIKELSEVMKNIAPVIRDYIGDALAPLSARLDEFGKRLDALPIPQDGKDADPEDVAAIVEGRLSPRLDAMDKALNDIPPAPELPDIPAMIAEAVKEAVDALPEPEKGDPGPAGEDGKSVTIEDIQPLIENHLAKWQLDFERRANDILQRAIDRLPSPKDGKDGKDGVDGMGFDDLDIIKDGERTFIFRMRRGERIKDYSFILPVMIYRGAYKADQTYEQGDTVSWGGSTWHCDKQTDGKPGDGDWTMIVRKGRDGKPGRDDK